MAPSSAPAGPTKQTRLLLGFLALHAAFVGASAAASAPASTAIPGLLFRPRTEAECTDVDLRDSMSPELRRFFSHPRWEGHYDTDYTKDHSLGYCYAMSSADLLSYQAGRPVSAMHILLEYSKELPFTGRAWRWVGQLFDTDSPILDGGTAYGALRLSLRSDRQGIGICPESAVSSTHFDLDQPNAFTNLKWALQLAKEGSPYYRDYLEASLMEKFFPRLGPTEVATRRRIESELLSSARNDERLIDLLAHLSELSCQGRMIPPPARPEDIRSVGQVDGDVLATIDAQLDRRPRPGMVSIMYDTGYTRSGLAPHFTPHFFGSHLSPIIARRFNEGTGRCEYRVRDSLFGVACDSYNPRNVRCNHDGTFWVSDKVLWRMTSWATYFKNPPSGSLELAAEPAPRMRPRPAPGPLRLRPPARIQARSVAVGAATHPCHAPATPETDLQRSLGVRPDQLMRTTWE